MSSTDRFPTRRLGRRAFLRGSTLFLASAFLPHGSAAWVEASVTSPLLKIGLLTDLHYADLVPQGTRYYRDSLRKVRPCVEHFNAARVDFAVELGDLIDAADTVDGELEHLRTVETEFARLRCERHYVLGNHCTWTLTKQQFRDHCGASEPFYSFDRARFHFVVLDACFRPDGVSYGARNFRWDECEVPPAEREWLAADLAKAQGPTVVLVHQRLDEAGVYSVRSAAAVRGILERSGRVLAVFQGHSHKNDYQEIRGIHYCTLAAMVEGPAPDHNAYSLLTVHPNRTLTLTGFANQSSRTFAFRQA